MTLINSIFGFFVHQRVMHFHIVPKLISILCDMNFNQWDAIIVVVLIEITGKYYALIKQQANQGNTERVTPIPSCNFSRQSLVLFPFYGNKINFGIISRINLSVIAWRFYLCICCLQNILHFWILKLCIFYFVSGKCPCSEYFKFEVHTRCKCKPFSFISSTRLCTCAK